MPQVAVAQRKFAKSCRPLKGLQRFEVHASRHLKARCRVDMNRRFTCPKNLYYRSPKQRYPCCGNPPRPTCALLAEPRCGKVCRIGAEGRCVGHLERAFLRRLGTQCSKGFESAACCKRQCMVKLLCPSGTEMHSTL